MKERVFLDHNAGSPLRPSAMKALHEATRANSYNPNGSSREGLEARLLLERARRRVAAVLDVEPEQLIFTGGGSSAIAFAIIGGALGSVRRGRARRIVTTNAEHPAVYEAAEFLERWLAFRVVRVPVNGLGLLERDALHAVLRGDEALVSVILANNEVGTISNPESLEAGGAPLHGDMVQAPGKLPVDEWLPNTEFASFAAHKFGGPRGCGLLYARDPELLESIPGGGEAGTPDPAAALATAAALEEAEQERESFAQRAARLTNRLLAGAESLGARLHGKRNAGRLANTLNLGFPGAPSRRLVRILDRRGFAVSSGAACQSASGEPSHVLLAMGLDRERALEGVRFSLGPETREEHIEALLEALPGAIEECRVKEASA